VTALGDKLKQLGVVGAGGAGFPSYVKANSQVELVLANGAECEPLLHKDYELMKCYPSEVISGMGLMMEATGARQGKFGIKEKNRDAGDAIRSQLGSKAIDMVLLGDFYPSGDEYELVHIATGRLIPPGGIPIQVGCVVNNVETLYNVHHASQGLPVTRKLVSIAGEVKEPKTVWAPIGTSFRDILKLAGGTTVSDYGIFASGLMMGTLTFDPDDVVTKTTSGLIVLPRQHHLVVRKSQPIRNMNRIGKSACDQCSFCTEFCPRYLLGYEVEPHKVMRSLGFTLTGADNWNQWAQLCCACGLCTLYACPEDLFPKEACDQGKASLATAGIEFTQKKELRVHPMKEHRRVPQTLLRKRLKVEQYERETPFDNGNLEPKAVKIKLSQHVGVPATPRVSKGDKVEARDMIAEVPESELGTSIHASIGGIVTEVTEEYIFIEG
jgi:Na+-translocating ferredoxin:NAD+ oxidoreductase RnfC subunit